MSNQKIPILENESHDSSFFQLESCFFEGNSSIFEKNNQWQQKQYKRKKKIPNFQISEDTTAISGVLTNERQVGANSESDLSEIYGYFNEDHHQDQPQNDMSEKMESEGQKRQKKLINPQFLNILKFHAPTQKKNNNVPKHFMKRLIESYSSKGKKFFEEDKQILKQVNKLMLYEKKMYVQNKNWNNNLDAMQKLFGLANDSKDPRKRSYLMRKMAHSLIRDQVIPGIYANKQIKQMTKSYIYTLKIQMLRCRNFELMKRTQIV